MATRRSSPTQPNPGHYTIKHELFWTVLLGLGIPLLSGIFYVGERIGNARYDMATNEVRESNKQLKDSLVSKHAVIERMKHVSDSALNIIGHMPYDQLKLDTGQFRKVQSTIEAAGAALYLNINYKK
ncbi:hypothetical protein [Mucilaginibacter flavidus]|uniref:hypothetical protein n=1 Tax=Mucilaginibacter flavidus TaxID=2949309 RepID=UPI0020934206|nr:hypothetical protein [Mucilaginibacter flavidus]MCO5950577.1 hypothetical protein [Mucilaginibacter flavidus]